ncbi:Tyrosine-protein kinase YwqD [Roseovarius albus]|uniref:Tyrosine-protein kinase YwqD n=1 Tax=Roseovarius albus TaxID=1247867 RepID=A0A1X6YV56_9RHOB|nr:CpsD/CapB family tyrosine-protein kinase [Roseovarius albus]SLN32374.1 Tyrosine-protein kinase YwqD [Roseovarius albus]
MERIQSAIEKARKTRNEQAQGANPLAARGSAPAARPVNAETGSEDALWQALPPFSADVTLLERNRIIADATSHHAAPYDILRTKLLQQMRKHNWRRVAITSHGPSNGKSMTAMNLAFSLAKQSELRTMVIELDMRRPSIARILGVNEPLQFSQALAGRDEAENHMLRYGDNLVIAMNQTGIRNSAEMLQGVTAARMLDEIEARYKPDIIIFDTPPLMVSDDTLAFLDQVDCALFVAEAEKTTPDNVDKAERELASRTNVLGVVLNKCRYMGQNENYGYYYGD